MASWILIWVFSMLVGIPAVSSLSIGSGTLVLMVPTADGLVIAADSRLTLANWGIACDNSYKIYELRGSAPAALVVTGNGQVFNYSNVPIREVCNQLPKFNISTILQEAINADPELITSSINQLPRIAVEELTKSINEDSNLYADLKGKQVFQVAIGSYDSGSRVSRIQSFAVKLTDDGRAFSEEPKVEEFLLADSWVIRALGEVSFFETNVLYGLGSQFLTQRYVTFRNGPSIVADTNSTHAADFAIDLIEAAARMTDFAPSATGIGGPVDVLLVGATLQRMNWKS